MKPHCGRHTTYDGWCPNCVALLERPTPPRREWVEELGAALCIVSGLLKNHEREMARGTMASLAMAEVALEKAVETERRIT